jgi:hypothetical protein
MELLMRLWDWVTGRPKISFEYPCDADVTARNINHRAKTVFCSSSAAVRIMCTSHKRGNFVLRFNEQCDLPNGRVEPGDELHVAIVETPHMG